ncbi:hypothetical protein ACLOJK_030635 [Asimina triloba]
MSATGPCSSSGIGFGDLTPLLERPSTRSSSASLVEMTASPRRTVFLGVDVGTGSARAGLFDEHGRLLGSASSPIQIWKDGDCIEQSSTDIWHAICAAVKLARAQANVAGEEVAGLGFAATCSLVAIDADGAPVTVSWSGDARRNIIVWMDHRAVKQAERINAFNSPVLQYCGGALSPEMEPPKLLWVKENLPESWSMAFRWMDLSDWLAYSRVVLISFYNARATGDDTRSLCTTVCKWTYLGHAHMNKDMEKDSRDMEACGWDDVFWEEIGLGDLVEGNHAKIVMATMRFACDFFFFFLSSCCIKNLMTVMAMMRFMLLHRDSDGNDKQQLMFRSALNVMTLYFNIQKHSMNVFDVVSKEQKLMDGFAVNDGNRAKCCISWPSSGFWPDNRHSKGEKQSSWRNCSFQIELGLLAGTPVGTSLIDAHAGGVGVMESVPSSEAELNKDDDDAICHRMVLVCGTSTCHMAVSHKKVFIPGVWGPFWSAMLPDYWLTEGGQSATGALLDHIIESHAAAPYIANRAAAQNISVYELLNRIVESMVHDLKTPFVAALTKDLHVLPDFHGNRSPIADPKSKGMFCGLTLDKSERQLALLYLATVQGIAYGTRHIVEHCNSHGHKIDTLMACGGLARNSLYVQEHADIVGCSIVLPRENESVLLGAAILGAVAAKKYSSLRDAMKSLNAAGQFCCFDISIVQDYLEVEVSNLIVTVPYQATVFEVEVSEVLL